MPINKNVIYCPGRDQEFERLADSMLLNVPNMHQEPLWGGDGTLDAVSANVKVYLAVHSHYELSVFDAAGQKWTAKQMAALMESDGLPKEHVNLVMMVCNAGLALNSKKSQQAMADIRARYVQAVESNDQQAIAKAQRDWAAAEKKAAKPSEYDNAKQTLPLVCELVDELKKRGYYALRVTAYKAPVAFIFQNGEVTLNMTEHGGQYGVPVSQCQDETVVWL